MSASALMALAGIGLTGLIVAGVYQRFLVVTHRPGGDRGAGLSRSRPRPPASVEAGKDGLLRTRRRRGAAGRRRHGRRSPCPAPASACWTSGWCHPGRPSQPGDALATLVAADQPLDRARRGAAGGRTAAARRPDRRDHRAGQARGLSRPDRAHRLPAPRARGRASRRSSRNADRTGVPVDRPARQAARLRKSGLCGDGYFLCEQAAVCAALAGERARSCRTGRSARCVLHGLLGRGRNWLSVARVLAEDHAVVLADLRNHGASPWSDEMDYAAMAGDVARADRGAGPGRSR